MNQPDLNPINPLPPHDESAEEAVVASLLVDQTVMPLIAGRLAPADFFREKNALIYAACRTLYDRGEAVNTVTVGHELHQRGQLEGAGGVAYLSQITTDLPTTVGAEWYAAIVARDAVYQRAIRELAALVRQAYQGGPEPEIFLSNLSAAQQVIAGTMAADDVETIADLTTEFWDDFVAGLSDRRRLRGISTGYASVDHYLSGRGLLPGKLYVVGGQTSTGKSTWLRVMLRNIALQGHHVALVSLEQDRREVWEELAFGLAGYDHAYHEQTGAPPDHGEEAALDTARNTLSCMGNFHLITTAGLNAAQIRFRVARITAEYPLAVVGIDYLRRMGTEKSGSRQKRGDEEIEATMKSLADTAKEFQVATVLMSQLSRANTDDRNRKGNEFRPYLSDFFGSSSIEQFAYCVMALHRRAYYVMQGKLDPKPDEDRVLGVLILKQQRGMTGTARLRFNGAVSSVEDFEA